MDIKVNIFPVLICLLLCSSLDSFDYNSTVLDKIISIPWVKYLVIIHRDFNETNGLIKALKLRRSIFTVNIAYAIDYSEKSSEILNENNLFLFVNSLQENIDEFESLLKTSLYRQRYIYLILTRMISKNVMVTTSKKVVQKHFMVNLVFVDLSMEKIYRYHPFTGDLLQSVDVGLVYEDFCHNMNGFPLKISIFPHFVAVWKDDHFEGSDGWMTLEILRHINASAEYTRPPPSSFYGQWYPNGSTTGQLHQIVSGDVHAAMNTGPITLEYYHQVDFTTTHDFDRIIILLTNNISTIRNVASVIPRALWVITCVFLLVHSVYLKTFVGYAWSDILLINIRLFTGNSVNNTPTRYSKIILMASVFYCYMLNNYFQSRLMSVLSVPKPTKRLETLREVAESDYNFNTENLVAFAVYHLKGPDMEYIQAIRNRTTVLQHQEYLARAATCPPKEGFLSAKYLNTFYFSTMVKEYDIKERCFYEVDQILAINWLSFRVTKGSPFLDKINRVVLGIVETGIRQHWNDITYHKIPEESAKGPKKLTMNSLLLCFYLLLLSWFICLIVFLFEMFTYKNTIMAR